MNETVTLPAVLIPGSYELLLSLPDADPGLSNRPEYAIRLANQGIWKRSRGYNKLFHTLTVSP